MFITIEKEHGRINYLVNNAGFGIFKELDLLHEKEIKEMIEIN